jgi:Flp pilus assembly protein TadB
MAQTNKRRRRKRRGTQGGKVDTRPRSRPRDRAEARQRAKSVRAGGSRKKAAATGAARTPDPPTWGSAVKKGLIAAGIFFALMALVFRESSGQSAAQAGVMLLFYIPMAYYTDRFFFNRNLRKQQQQRAKASGHGDGDGG